MKFIFAFTLLTIITSLIPFKPEKPLLMQDVNIFRYQLPDSTPVTIFVDPKATKAAASYSVAFGSAGNPIAGTAHLLEHMVFAGSRKYKGVSTFDSYISTVKGRTNASTYQEKTVYCFDSNFEGFAKGLDMFINALTRPVLAKEAILKEKNAVDSEFNILRNKYGYISMSAQQMMGNQTSHYTQFTAGNNEEFNKHSDDDLHKTLKKLHAEQYRAGGANLVIYTNKLSDKIKAHLNTAPKLQKTFTKVKQTPMFEKKNAVTV